MCAHFSYASTRYDRTPTNTFPFSLTDPTSSRSRRLLLAQQKFLRAVATALVRKHITTSTSSDLAGAAAVTAAAAGVTSNTPHAVAVTHRAFLRSITTSSAAGRTPANLKEMGYVAYAAVTTSDLARVLGGNVPSDQVTDTVVSSSTSSKYGMSNTRNGLSTPAVSGLRKELARALSHVVGITKEFLANPWVDLGIVAAALAAVSWFYVRRLSGRNDFGIFADDSSGVANNDTQMAESGSEGDVESSSNESNTELQTLLAHLSTLEAQITHLEQHNTLLTNERDALAARAQELATALERTIKDAAGLDEKVADREAVIEKLEEENKVLFERLTAALTSPTIPDSDSDTGIDQNPTSSPQPSATSLSPPAVEKTSKPQQSPLSPILHHVDSDDWEHLSDIATPPAIE